MTSHDLETTLQKVSRIITDRYGLRLVCRGDECKTDGKTIYLPSLPDSVPDTVLGAIRGWCDHEAAHIIYTQTRLGPKFQREHGPRAFGVLNVLEDARIERLMARRYPGSALNLDDAFEFVSKRAARRITQDPFQQFTSALYIKASGRADQSWMPKEAYGLVGACQDELSQLPSCRSTGKVAEVALKVWEKVKERFPEDERSKPEQPGPQTEPGEADPSQEQAPQRQGSPEPTEGGPQQKKAQGTDSANGVPGGGSGTQSPLDELGAAIEAELKAQRQGEEAGAYRVYTTEYDVVEVPKADRGFDYRREIEALRPYVSGLLRRLVQTLEGKKETRWLRDKARGRLDPASLHRLCTGRSGRIFRQRTVADGGVTACTLLLDLSSSMSGEQIRICRQLALVFGETLSRLGFPTEIIGFSTLDRDLRCEVAQETGKELEELARLYARMVPLYLGLFKQFEEPWHAAAPRLGSVECKALTPMGEALLFAGKRLAARPEKRKVLFCLTDGQPVVGAWDEQVTLNHACEAVQKLTAAGIEPVGIGIMQECVQTIFPRHAVIHDLRELPRRFVGELCGVLVDNP